MEDKTDIQFLLSNILIRLSVVENILIDKDVVGIEEHKNKLMQAVDELKKNVDKLVKKDPKILS